MNSVFVIIFSMSLLIFFQSASLAASINNAELNSILLTLSKQKQQRVKAKKKSVAIRPSRNCLKWSAKKINQKAKRFDKIISQVSKKYRVDGDFIKAIITAESCFRTKALSNKGARGLMQLIPATAKRFGVKNSYKAEQNIRGGTRYLKFLIGRFKGDLKKVIAAYNAGEGSVDKYKGIPPYKETRLYVKNVLRFYMRLKPKASRVKAIYYPPKKGEKPGRHGWQYNKHLAPHLYKKLN